MYKGASVWRDRKFHYWLYFVAAFVVSVVIGYIVWKY